MSTFIAVIDTLKPALLSILPALIAVWLGYRLGLLGYFARKEHEKIVQRYLETGIDLISSNTDHALSIVSENFAHSLRLLKEFRSTEKTGLPLRKESLRNVFLKYETSSFSVTPFYRVKSITGDDIFWEAYQLLFAFVGATYDFYENDLRLVLEAYSEDRIQISSHEKFYDEYIKEIHRLNKEASKFYLILKELQNIALYVETKPIDFRSLERLRDLPEIKQSIVSLRKVFADTNPLSENENQIKIKSDLFSEAQAN